MQCKGCGGKMFVKNGFVRDRQRYRCSACGLNQIKGDRRRKYDGALKRQAIAMYLNSSGIRSIGRVLGVPFQLVARWVEDAGKIVEQEFMARRAESRHISILEMDELYTYVQKKSATCAYGWLWIGTEMKWLRLTSAAERGKMRASSTGSSTATRST